MTSILASFSILAAVIVIDLNRRDSNEPQLVATVSATSGQNVTVTGRGFPAQAAVNINASTGGYSGRAFVRAGRDGRVTLRFKLPSHFFGSVQFKANAGERGALASLWVPLHTLRPLPVGSTTATPAATSPATATATATPAPAVPPATTAPVPTPTALGAVGTSPVPWSAAPLPVLTPRASIPGSTPLPATAPAPATAATPAATSAATPQVPRTTAPAQPVVTTPPAATLPATTTPPTRPTPVRPPATTPPATRTSAAPPPASEPAPVPLVPGDLWAATNGGQAPAYGVNTHPTRAYQSDYASQFARFASIGADWIRADVNWGAIEQSRDNQYNSVELEKLDKVVASARSNNLNILLALLSPPDWSNSPNNPAPFGDFAKFLGTRYTSDGSGPLVAFEMWNEPNGIGNPMSPAVYARLACAGYEGVKSSGTRAPVIAGSLAMNNWNPWLDQAFDAGLGNCLDALSIHPYEGSDYIAGSHRVMVDHGVGDRPIWYTEFGWSTCPSCSDDESEQAAKVIARLNEAKSHPYVTVAIQYEDRDEPLVSPSIEQHFGIFRADSSGKATTPKPVFDALRTYLSTQ